MSVLRFSVLLLFTFLLSRCALHPPVSEHLIFSEASRAKKVQLQGLETGIIKALHTSGFEQQAASARGLSTDSTLNPAWEGGLSLLGFSVEVEDRFALGISPGIIIVGSGTDATLRLSEREYLTISGNLYRNFEVIAQRRVYQNLSYGLSLGVFYRHEKQEIGATSPILWEKLFRSSVFGLRGLYHLESEDKSIRLITAIGVERATQEPVAYLGLAIHVPFPRDRWASLSRIYDF